jgi:hypothetical protein
LNDLFESLGGQNNLVVLLGTLVEERLVLEVNRSVYEKENRRDKQREEEELKKINERQKHTKDETCVHFRIDLSFEFALLLLSAPLGVFRFPLLALFFILNPSTATKERT